MRSSRKSDKLISGAFVLPLFPKLAQTVADVVGFKGTLRYDATKPDGTPRKLLDVSRIRGLGWSPRVPLREGIARTYEDALRAKLFDAPAAP